MKKTSKTKTARVYSTALYEAAVEKGVLAKVYSDVKALNEITQTNTDLADYLANPLWSEVDKTDALQKIAKTMKLNEETLNCLKLIVENRRSTDLPLILSEFDNLYNAKNNVAEVVVETVKKLTSAQDSKLKKVLENLLARKVVVEYKLNASILGGLKVYCESKMYDDSLAHKLNYLENIMKGK